MQGDLNPRCIYIRYGICSCKANKLTNRQCLFFLFALFGYVIGSRYLSMSNYFFCISLDVTFSNLNSE